jgi:hypothetical protein
MHPKREMQGWHKVSSDVICSLSREPQHNIVIYLFYFEGSAFAQIFSLTFLSLVKATTVTLFFFALGALRLLL